MRKTRIQSLIPASGRTAPAVRATYYKAGFYDLTVGLTGKECGFWVLGILEEYEEDNTDTDGQGGECENAHDIVSQSRVHESDEGYGGARRILMHRDNGGT